MSPEALELVRVDGRPPEDSEDSAFFPQPQSPEARSTNTAKLNKEEPLTWIISNPIMAFPLRLGSSQSQYLLEPNRPK